MDDAFIPRVIELVGEPRMFHQYNALAMKHLLGWHIGDRPCGIYFYDDVKATPEQMAAYLKKKVREGKRAEREPIRALEYFHVFGVKLEE